MDLSLFFAGTAGSAPTARRGLPAVLVRRGGEKLLVDCGEGTQRQLLSTVGLPEIDRIYLTHLHADHWLGVPPLLKTFELRERRAPLDLYGPPGTEALMETMRKAVFGKLGYPFAVHDLEAGDVVEHDGFEMHALTVRHRGAAYGYALIEEDRPGRFDAELAESLGVPSGPEFGRLQRGETVNGVRPEQVVGEDRRGRKLVISGDTMPCDMVRVAADGADVLVHEATFTEEERERAAQTGHSTARQAAQLALEAGVGMLVLTHLSQRYFPREIREEAREVFPGAKVARDFDTVEIPFPERGEPMLEHWPEAAPAVT